MKKIIIVLATLLFPVLVLAQTDYRKGFVDNSGAVDSWKGRTGAVVPANADYSFAQLSDTLVEAQDYASGLTPGTYVKCVFDDHGRALSGVTQLTLTTDVTGILPKANGGTGQSAALKDTTIKGYAFTALAVTDSGLVFECRESGTIIREIRAIRTGGTSASVNATKNGSTDLLTANYATSTSMASAGTLQNTTLAIGDLIRVAVRAISGTAQEIFIQIMYDKTQN